MRRRRPSDRPRERLLVAPPDLADVLAAATVYVGAAGTTAVQAACVGHPCGRSPPPCRISNAQAAALAARRVRACGGRCADLAGACLTLLDDSARASDDGGARSRTRRWTRRRASRRGNPPPGRCAGRVMTTVAVIQARCGSTRFPRKVLAPLQGRPMLAHIIERVSRASLVDRVVVATTDGRGDDEVAALALASGAGVTRGSEDDVLSRYVHRRTRARRRRHRAHHRRLPARPTRRSSTRSFARAH